MDVSLYYKIPFMMLRLRRNQRLKPPEIRELQNQKLRTLVKHSYDHVPYYHTLFNEAKIRPTDIKTIEDLKKIPISKKANIRNLPVEQITANNFDLSKCVMIKTSGTSGIPFSVYLDKNADFERFLKKYVLQLDCGDKIYYKRVMLNRWAPEPPNYIQKLGIFRTKFISPFYDPKIQVQQMEEFDPKTVLTLPSCILSIAKEIRELDVNVLQISLIFIGGEFLDPYIHKVIQDTFEAQVYQAYGATEVGRIATDCIEHSCHTHSDASIVEITRDGESLTTGEEGTITVTNLDYYAMPFIRYNLEDFGIILEDECTCGCFHPLLKLTSGRVSDVIQLPDGRMVSAHEVNIFLTFFSGIKQFQVIQETIDQLTVKIVKGREFTDTTIKEIKQRFNERLSNDIEINVLVVDHISREPSGKFKVFKTNIPVK